VARKGTGQPVAGRIWTRPIERLQRCSAAWTRPEAVIAIQKKVAALLEEMKQTQNSRSRAGGTSDGRRCNPCLLAAG